MSRYLVVMPDDSSKPILDAINHAKKSLRIKMFLFSDPQLLHAVIAAHRRGVKVRIMLNPARRSGEKENADVRKLLTDAAIEVIDSNPGIRRDPREVDGGGRRDRVHPVAELGDQEPYRDARLRGGDVARPRSERSHGVLRRRLGAARVSIPATIRI